MISVNEFIEFVDNLENPIVELKFDFSKSVVRTIDLKKFSKDIHNYKDFFEWWKSKNLTKHLQKTIIKTILKMNPPEKIKQTLLFLEL